MMKQIKLPKNFLIHLKIDAGVQWDIFQGKGGFVELGYFDKLFIKNARKKCHPSKNFWAFSCRYS